MAGGAGTITGYELSIISFFSGNESALEITKRL